MGEQHLGQLGYFGDDGGQTTIWYFLSLYSLKFMLTFYLAVSLDFNGVSYKKLVLV
jgi:hypothetical protein